MAAIVCVYYAPASMGSGVAEVMGLLNGINYNGAIEFRTFFGKYFGVLFAICSGLCIGMEGPLVHMGAIVGVAACYIPGKWYEYLQNDVHRRQMIAAGAGCGIAVSFGAPIGGALFAYEISKPNTFWTFSGLWKVFAATSIAVFTLSILWSLSDGAPLSISDSAALKFGDVTQVGQNTILDLPAAIFLGIIAGLMGAAFIGTTIRTAILRKRFVNNNWKKVVECVIFCFATVTVFYLVVCARR